MLDINNIYLGDCLSLMDDIDDKSVDMILCDLPYGSTAPKWDVNIDIVKLWKSYNRIIKKNGTIALFSAQPFTTKLIASNDKKFKYTWYWLKNQGTNFFHAARMPIRKVEDICIFNKGKYNPQILDGFVPTNSAIGKSQGATYFGTNTRNSKGGKTTRYPTNILEFKCVSNYKRLHSAQKPTDLCEYLIKTYTDTEDLVLDNCAGSGTTGEACINTKRNYILIEKEEKYCNITKERLSL